MLSKKIILLAFIFSIVFSINSYAKSVAIYFPFADIFGNILRDHSGNSNNAHVKGSPLLVKGKFGKALEFDGDDMIILSHKDSYYLGKDNSYSLSFWINYKQNGTNQVIIEKMDKMYPFKIEIEPDNKLCFSISDGTSTSKATINSIGEDWHYYCFVRDIKDDRLYIYLDGNLSAEVEDTMENEINNKSDIVMGAFHGIMDEFAMYDRALTKDEIKKAVKGSLPDIYRESSLRRFEIISTISIPFTAIHSYLITRGIEMARKGKVAPKFSETDWLIAGGLTITFSGLIGFWDYLKTNNDDILELPNLSTQDQYTFFDKSLKCKDSIVLAYLYMRF